MDNLELPKQSVLMVSPRDYRLSSLTGFCVNFKANEPILVPPHVYVEALREGARLVGDLPEEEAVEEVPVVSEMDPDERSTLLDQAIANVIVRNDPSDFKKDNTPKAAKVIAELDPEFEPRPTATEIFESYERLQDNMDLAED